MLLHFPRATPRLLAAALAVTTASCGATRPQLKSTRPWKVAAETMDRKPAPIPAKPYALVEATREQMVADPRLAEKVTLRSENTELRSLLLGLSKQTGINIVLDDEVTGTVSAFLNDVPVIEALKRIIAPLGFELEMSQGFLRVYEPRVETKIFRLHYLRGERSGESTVSMVDRSSASSQMDGQGGMGGGMSSGMTGGMGGMGGQGGMQTMGAMQGGPGGGSQTEIKSKFEVNFWSDLSAELEALVFEGASDKELVKNDRGEAGVSIYEKIASPADEKEAQPAAPPPLPGRVAAPTEPGAPKPASITIDEKRRKGRALTVNSMSGTIVVRAKPETLAAVDAYLKAVEETVQRQVVIDIRILEVSLSDNKRYGVEALNLPLLPSDLIADLDFFDNPEAAVPKATSPGGFPNKSAGVAGLQTDAAFPRLTPDVPAYGITLGDDVNWKVVMSALGQLGDVKVVSAPRISSLHNQKAIVKVVRDRVFFMLQAGQTALGGQGTAVTQQSQFVPIVVPEGVVVDVTPLIGDDGSVTLEVHPSFSVIFNEKQAPGGQGSQPEVERRELQTTVRVKGNETVVLGGLVTERTQRRESGIPYLKDIPFLGALFRSTEDVTERSELIMLLTPRIQGQEVVKEYVDSLGRLAKDPELQEREEKEEEERKKAGKSSEASPAASADTGL